MSLADIKAKIKADSQAQIKAIEDDANAKVRGITDSVNAEVKAAQDMARKARKH